MKQSLGKDIEEKATLLGKKYFPDAENIWARSNLEAECVTHACLEMAKWLIDYTKQEENDIR